MYVLESNHPDKVHEAQRLAREALIKTNGCISLEGLVVYGAKSIDFDLVNNNVLLSINFDKNGNCKISRSINFKYENIELRTDEYFALRIEIYQHQYSPSFLGD